MCATMSTIRKSNAGNIWDVTRSPKVTFLWCFCCHLSNFLPLLSPSPWRVILQRRRFWEYHHPCPWATPPLRVRWPDVRWPLYYSVWQCQAITALMSNDMPGLTAHLSSGCHNGSFTVISISTSYFTLSTTPSSNLPLLSYQGWEES